VLEEGLLEKPNQRESRSDVPSLRIREDAELLAEDTNSAKSAERAGEEMSVES